ncbi:MAG TPA: DUF5655 domain-containing protein [Acidimicrobiia bacterium]|nr:DUF5655 domain-containing protein [Acidimicrobiia bacterium]
MGPEDLFTGHPLGVEACEKVSSILDGIVDVEVRTTKSQVAFFRKRGFAYIWPPGNYLAKPDAEVVLSIALGRHDDSERWKEVVHPASRHWMHHLEVRRLEDIDEEVARWLVEAAERAG